MKTATILDNDTLRRIAPSIFAEQPYHKVSERYAFIPTIDVINQLRANGFQPVRAAQSLCRIDGKKDFTKHLIRFRREQDVLTQLGDELPEIVLVNSHDRSSSYELSAGFFRLACLNGMVVKSADFGSIKIQHSGNIVDRVIAASYTIIAEVPALADKVRQYKSLALSDSEKQVFAESVMELRYPTPVDEAGAPAPDYAPPFTATKLLTTRRSVDQGSDLWRVGNVVQENIMRGGLRSQSSSGRRNRTRGIKSVNEEMRFNKALWMLMEKMSQLKAAQ